MSEWMTPQQVAAEFGTTTEALRKNRALRRGYPFHKPNGGRTVLYKRSEVEAVVEASRVPVTRTA